MRQSLQSERFPNVLHLEVTCLDDRQLKTSLYSRASTHDDTLRTVEEQRVSLEKITGHSQRMLSMLNQANRNGRLSATLLETLKETGQFLRDELFSPALKARLNASDARYMTIIIDERLVHIPWEMLYNGRQFLCQQFALGRLVQTRLNVPGIDQKRCRGPMRVMILADLDGSLPAARKEGAEVRDFIESATGDIRVMMRTANVDADYVRTKIRSFDWIHFAGHVDVDGDTTHHGWRLSEGRFSAEDVAKMTGTGHMPALLFANGCQSARTHAWSVDPERRKAFFGLVNTFLLSGTRHYVGPSWEIPDEPGRCFALAFYRRLMAGATIGCAVADARKQLIETCGEEQVVWASYVLYGDPTHRYVKAEASFQSSPRTGEHRGIPLLAATRAGEDPPPPSDTVPLSHRWSRTRILFSAGLLVALALVLTLTIPSLWPGKKNQRLHQAMAAYDAGDLETVLDICPPPTADAMSSNGCVLLRANALFARGRLDEAAAAYAFVSTTAHATAMESAEAWMGVGRIASIRGETEQAMACYERAANAAPYRPEPLVALAVLNEEGGKDATAMAYLDAAKHVAPAGDIAIDAMARSLAQKTSLTGDTSRMARVDRLIDELRLDRQPSTPPAPADEKKGGPLSLWIMNMQSSGYCLREGDPQAMTVMIENCLQDRPSVRIADRHLMDKTLAELKLGSSKLVEHQLRLQLGRLQAVQMMVNGRMIFSGAETQVTLRCIDVQTSRIEAVVVMTFERRLPVAEMARQVTDQLLEKIDRIHK